MTELMDIRLQHHIANEIYRQQMLQRLPGKFEIFKNIAPKKVFYFFLAKTEVFACFRTGMIIMHIKCDDAITPL